MTIGLTATSGSTMSVPSEEGACVLALAAPADVTLVVTLDVTTPAETPPAEPTIWHADQAVPASFALVSKDDVKSTFSTVLPSATAAFGTYTIKSGADTIDLILKQEQDDTPAESPSPGQQVLEVATGVYDRGFAVVTGLATIAFAVLILVSSLVAIAGNGKRTRSVIVTHGWVTNTLAERSAGTVQLLALGLGGVLVLIGAWQASLEVRGRLSAQIQTRGGPEERGLGKEVGQAVAQVIDSLRQARGTVVTLAVGALIVLGSLWATAYVAASSHGPGPAPTGSSSPTPTSSSPTPTSSSPTPTSTPS